MRFIGLLGDNTSLSDITSFKIQSDTGAGNGYHVTSGDIDFKILGGNGINVTNSLDVFTVTVVAGEINHDSLAGFAVNEHIDWTMNYLGADIAADNIPTLNQSTTGNARTATALATQRDLKVDLGEANEDSFDGSGDALSIGVGTSVLGISNGGTGQATAQAALNALAGGTASGRYLRGNGSNISLAAIPNSDIGTLNQDTTGSAATLTTARAFQTDLASTSSANFDGSATNTHGVTGTLAVGNGGTGLTSISTLVNPTLIDSDTMSGASATNVASAESIKAYVDARYSYQYITFFGSVSAANNNNGGPYYIFTSGNGISNHSWTKYNMGGSSLAITNDTIDLGVDVNCSQLAVSTYLATNQIVVPQTSEIVGFYATNRSGSNGYHVGNAIFVIPESGVNWGDSTSMTAFLKYRSISSAHSGTDENFSSSNVNTSKVMMCHDMTRGTYEVAAGSIIIPSLFCDTHSQVAATSMTIVLRTKI